MVAFLCKFRLSAAKTNNKTELVIADISMEDEQLLPINQD
jgi:hypothetical protein